MDQFINLFRDPIWTFVSTVVALVTLVVMLITAHQKRPQLTCQLLDYEVTPKQYPKLGIPVGANRATLRIRNSGTAIITCGNYEYPPRFAFQFFRRTHIYYARISDSSPHDLKEVHSLAITPKQMIIEPRNEDGKSIIQSYDELDFPPMLLHPGDSVTAEAWISPPSAFTQFVYPLFGMEVKPTIKVVGRIEGVRQIQVYEKGSAWKKVWIVAATSVIALLLATTVANFLPLPLSMPGVAAPFLLLVAVILVTIRWQAIWALRGTLLVVGMLLFLYVLLQSLLQKPLAAAKSASEKPDSTPAGTIVKDYSKASGEVSMRQRMKSGSVGSNRSLGT